MDDERIISMLEDVPDNSTEESNSELENDHCSDHIISSGTEQGASSVESSSGHENEDESDDDVPLSFLRSNSLPIQGAFYVAKDGQKWYRLPQRPNVRTRSVNIVNERPGVQGEAKEAMNESECWKIYITMEMKNAITTHTNAEIKIRQEKCNDRSKLYYMNETTISELDAFLGLLYIAGLNKSGRQNIKDLWRTDGTGVDIFRTTMSLQRFYFLQNCVRFDDKSTRNERKAIDNIAAIRSIFDSFVLNCQKAYIPHEYMTIDEMLWAFRGRCGFRVYIPSKPAKYGIKAYALVDAKSFYTFNIEVYPGKQPDGPHAFSNKAYDVVDRLVQSITKSHRNLTFDNWFTSYKLMKHLLAEHRLTATGTVRKNKRCIPNSFLKTGKQPASSMFGLQRDVSIVSYARKKNKVVILMSTLHHDDLIDVTTGDKRKPEMGTFYNSTKAGVDVVDEMSVNYDVSRNSKRWPMTVFYAILNIAAINANIIYRANRNLNTKRTEFNLGLSLVYEHLRQRKDKTNIPLYIRNRISSQIGEASASLSSQNIGARPVRCRDCPNKKDRKTKNACKHCGKAICKEHAVLFCNDCANVQD
ncbi:unnamed protein product [Arctia plantaginis]|uniref:PiggyBac transposable element-derived protein domain-containing protein n=1 Tax=Arctia plantaginis TaxID=874455 RepID=A0A8S0YPJ9_ARCPL|nr:unnamed protein product [Arctia plantaginis]